MSDSNHPVSATVRWQKAMWFGAGLGLLLTITILLIGVGIVLWRALSIIENKSGTDHLFIFSSVGLVTVTLIRLLSVLIGAAISFTGLAISFFVYEKATNLSGAINTSEITVAKATLATYSPGIVGMVVGAIIIVCAIFSKSEFKYKSPSEQVIETRPAKQAASVNSRILMPTGDQVSSASESE